MIGGMTPQRLTALLARLAPKPSKPHTHKGHRKAGAQKRNEARRLRCMTPILPPASGQRREEFSSPVAGAWGAR